MLQRAAGGDRGALEGVVAAVEGQLRLIAAQALRGERPGHTLQPTALANEAFLRLVDQRVAWNDRVHFFAIAATAMRRVLVDHARARARLKRGGGSDRVALPPEAIAGDDGTGVVDCLALDEALEALRALHERQARIVELRFFGGMAMRDIAELLGVSLRSVEGDWAMARAWLRRRLGGDDS